MVEVGRLPELLLLIRGDGVGNNFEIEICGPLIRFFGSSAEAGTCRR